MVTTNLLSLIEFFRMYSHPFLHDISFVFDRYKHRDFLKEHLDAFLALTLNKPLPLESMLMLPDFFRYKDPKQINAPSLTVCACAKCGTTSL